MLEPHCSFHHFGHGGRNRIDESQIRIPLQILNIQNILDKNQSSAKTQYYKNLEYGEIKTYRSRSEYTIQFVLIKNGSAQAVSAITLRCSMVTPLGLPVDPDV
jgi:hypothetical protein